MVLLTMTPAMVAALAHMGDDAPAEPADASVPSPASTPAPAPSPTPASASTETDTGALAQPDDTDADTAAGPNDTASTAASSDPSLAQPVVGAPISHAQILGLWKTLATRAQPGTDPPPSLESLLVGARVYVAPPPPKKEPTAEFQALMARLRRDEEERAYERMVRAPEPALAASATAAAFASANRPRAADVGDDNVTLADVNRQVMLIFNFLLSMLGVAYALWVLARWWPTSARLFLAMGGSAAVGAAEYGLYAGYKWHLGEAAKKDKRDRTDCAPADEVREVVHTWVVELDAEADKAVALPGAQGASGVDTAHARRRKTTR